MLNSKYNLMLQPVIKENYIFLTKLMITREYRKLNLSKKLLAEAEKFTKSKNKKFLVLDCNDYMLDFKKEKMDEHSLTPNKEYYHIPCNFNEVNWIRYFSEHNINPNIPTLVLWEGVTYFLPEDLITSTLTELKNYFSAELQITLDYAYRDYINGNLNFYGAKELYNVLVEIGEPHFFGLNYNESEIFLKNLDILQKRIYQQ